MNTIIQSKAIRSLSSITTLGVFLVLGLSSVLLIGTIAPAAAGKSSQNRTASMTGGASAITRDHRDGPKVIHDHQNGTTIHDQRAPVARGGVTVKDGKPRPRHIPCYGNLC